MKDSYLIVNLSSDDEVALIFYKYIRLWFLSWSDRKSCWTKKGKQRQIDHANKINRHLKWLVNRHFENPNTWSVRVLGSHRYLDLKYHSNQEFLVIVTHKQPNS